MGLTQFSPARDDGYVNSNDVSVATARANVRHMVALLRPAGRMGR